MPAVELSTLAFFRGEVPREISLRDCSIPVAGAPRHALVTLYGNQGKQEGFLAARAYADAQRLDFTVLDLTVGIDAQNPQVMKPLDLPVYDFLNLERASRPLCDEMGRRLRGVKNLDPALAEALDSAPLRAVMAEHPALADPLMALDGCGQLKILAFRAVSSLTPRPISLGCLSHVHWAAIREANCRLHPNVRIRLDAPA